MNLLANVKVRQKLTGIGELLVNVEVRQELSKLQAERSTRTDIGEFGMIRTGLGAD